MATVLHPAHTGRNRRQRPPCSSRPSRHIARQARALNCPHKDTRTHRPKPRRAVNNKRIRLGVSKAVKLAERTADEVPSLFPITQTASHRDADRAVSIPAAPVVVALIVTLTERKLWATCAAVSQTHVSAVTVAAVFDVTVMARLPYGAMGVTRPATPSAYCLVAA